jgi:ribose/xylose/arabinose/galactoside ABC-type transport system permease subunit
MGVAQSLTPARRPRPRTTFESRGVLRILIVLAGLVVLAAILSDGVFLQLDNIINLGQQNAILMVVALGQLFVILTGGIDLSVGATLAIGSVVYVVLQDAGPVAALAGALATAGIIGLVNGALVTFIRLPSFVVTLAVSQIVASLAMVISEGGTVYTGYGGAQISSLTSNFYAGAIGGVPNHVLFALFVGALIALFMRTSWGHFSYAVGGNRQAAFLSGLPVAAVGVMVYVMAAMLASVGGILFVSRVGLGDPQAAKWIVLDSIAAVSIGGASLSGGVGTVAGTLIGVLILGVLNNIMNLLGVPPTLQPAIKGLVILIAVLLNSSRKGK